MKEEKEQIVMKTYERSKYWDQMIDILDEHFPKGKSKERGAAMVMLAYIDFLIQGREFNKKIK